MQLLQMDSLAWISIGAYLVLALITFACAPKRDAGPKLNSGALLIVLGSVIAYAAGSLWVALVGWILTILPVWMEDRTKPKLMLTASAVSLFAGALLYSIGEPGSAEHTAAFWALAVAVLLRKGIVPFHFWVNEAFEGQRLSLLSLLLNAHLGGYMMIRFGVPLFREVASQAISLLGILSIITAVYMALLAISERRPRRILALLCTSQASFILAGLQNRNVEGIMGALLHWWVVAFATTTVISVYRLLEVRSTEVESPKGFLGFAFHAPRLAVCFAVAGLALVGMPGTLGFVAEDLLFHGSIESHPLLGIGLPLATALNAITVLRLFATLFLGRRGLHVPKIADARPRERWALTAAVVLLVAGGLIPSIPASLRSDPAHALSDLLTTPEGAPKSETISRVRF
jgi:NADH-quinone oxidoreductase subunit M